MTEADVVGFAALSGDWTTIHTDAVYAAQEPFGQRVAHGMLVLSIGVALAARLGFMEGTVLAFREIGEWIGASSGLGLYLERSRASFFLSVRAWCC